MLRCFTGLLNMKATAISDTPHLHVGLPGSQADPATAPTRQTSGTGFKLKAHSSTAQRKEGGFRRQITHRILVTFQVIAQTSVSSCSNKTNSPFITELCQGLRAAMGQSQGSVWFYINGTDFLLFSIITLIHHY